VAPRAVSVLVLILMVGLAVAAGIAVGLYDLRQSSRRPRMAGSASEERREARRRAA